MDEVEVVVAHRDRATLRVGDVFVKVDADQANLDAEAGAMARVPVPTPRILWQKPHVLAVEAVRGSALGRLGQPSSASSAAWVAVGAAVRRLHDSPLPSRAARFVRSAAPDLDEECRWLVANGILPSDLVERNRRIAEMTNRPFEPAFTHGDLQITHVFVDGDAVTGVIDWSEAGPGDPLFDLGTLTLGHQERLSEVLQGYGGGVDVEILRAWWSRRSLVAIRWLLEHGFDPFSPGCEVDVLRAQGDGRQDPAVPAP